MTRTPMVRSASSREGIAKISVYDYRENDRAAGVERMAEQPLDVLVIGGGIVGSGVARDAAMRGLRIGLVEQYDFGSGTSSRSSRCFTAGSAI